MLPLDPSQKNISRKLPMVHARNYIAIKLFFQNIPLSLTAWSNEVVKIRGKEGAKEVHATLPKYGSFIHIPKEVCSRAGVSNLSGPVGK